MTVVVDARKQPPAPVLFSALRSVQVCRALHPCAGDVLVGSLSRSRSVRATPAPTTRFNPWLAAASSAAPGTTVPGAVVFISLDFTHKCRGADALKQLSAAPQYADPENPCPSRCCPPSSWFWLLTPCRSGSTHTTATLFPKLLLNL